MVAKTWYPSNDAELRQLASDGLSSHDIAAHMGRSQYSILSRMGRIGIKSTFLVNRTWFEEDDAILRQMVADNCTARQMAETLGTTRNSIIGRMRRIGLKSTWLNQHCMGNRKPLSRAEKATKSRDRWKAWQEKNPRQHKVRSALSPAVTAERLATMQRNAQRREAMKAQILINAVPFIERKPEQCCWPLWKDGAPFSWEEPLMCCGAKAEATGPYCPAHAYRASNWVKGAFVRQPGYFKSWVNTGRAA